MTYVTLNSRYILDIPVHFNTHFRYNWMASYTLSLERDEKC